MAYLKVRLVFGNVRVREVQSITQRVSDVYSQVCERRSGCQSILAVRRLAPR